MINSKLMKMFVEKAVAKLNGEWIVIGGTVLPLIGVDHRVTVDIDLVNLNFKSSNSDNVTLMEIAQELKLPVESINQAGAYYLSKMDDVNQHLVLLQGSKKCKIYRPDAYLFIKLKIDRFSATDLEDCIHFLSKNKEEWGAHHKAISKMVSQKAKKSSDEMAMRFSKLNEFLKGQPA